MHLILSKPTYGLCFLLLFFSVLACKDSKNFKADTTKEFITNNEKTETVLNRFPYNDTIFLGFRLGMSESEFNSHLKDLVKSEKLKYSNNSIFYNLKFKRQVLENEDDFLDDFSQMITNEKEGEEPKEKVIELSYDGILKPKFGDKKLYELTLTFKNTTNLRSQFALPYILESMVSKYGCFENNEIADYYCYSSGGVWRNGEKISSDVKLAKNMGKDMAFNELLFPNLKEDELSKPDETLKALVDGKIKNKSLYWWKFPNGFKISIQGEYDLPHLLNSRKIAIQEKVIALTYLSYKDKESYLNNQEVKINMDNKNSATDF